MMLVGLAVAEAALRGIKTFRVKEAEYLIEHDMVDRQDRLCS